MTVKNAGTYLKHIFVEVPELRVKLVVLEARDLKHDASIDVQRARIKSLPHGLKELDLLDGQLLILNLVVQTTCAPLVFVEGVDLTLSVDNFRFLIN